MIHYVRLGLDLVGFKKYVRYTSVKIDEIGYYVRASQITEVLLHTFESWGCIHIWPKPHVVKVEFALIFSLIVGSVVVPSRLRTNLNFISANKKIQSKIFTPICPWPLLKISRWLLHDSLPGNPNNLPKIATFWWHYCACYWSGINFLACLATARYWLWQMEGFRRSRGRLQRLEHYSKSLNLSNQIYEKITY